MASSAMVTSTAAPQKSAPKSAWNVPAASVFGGELGGGGEKGGSGGADAF